MDMTQGPAAPSLRDLEALLDFLQAAGVDGLLEEAPVDRFALPAEAEASRSAPAQRPEMRPDLRPAAPATPGPGVTAPTRAAPVPAPLPGGGGYDGAVIPGEETVVSAREAARSAETLEALRACLAAFKGCNLHLTAKNLVFDDGNPQARVMLVGEAPGRDEDLQGLPFVGRSGQLLDRMLKGIGLDRSQVYIANVVPWRPPGNRTPTPQETEICKPFIARQIELADPDILVFLGAASAKALLGVQDGIRKMRGRWMTYDTGRRQIRCIATFHPAYLLRSPLEKRLAWRDFLALRQALLEG